MTTTLSWTTIPSVLNGLAIALRPVGSVPDPPGPPPAPILDIHIPVYGVKIQDRSSAGGSAYYFTSARTVNGGAFDAAAQILIPLVIQRDCDPRESRFNTSTLTFQLTDIGHAATAVVSALIGLQCTFYMGEWGGDWTAAAVLFVGIVREFTLADNGYAITVASPIVLADKELFNAGKSTIVTGISAGDLAVVVADASDFEDTGDLLIESERIHFSIRNDNGTNWTLGGLTRGISGSTPTSHAAGIAVSELFILGPAHPFDILATLLAGDASRKTGLGMAAYINVANLAAEKTSVGATLEMAFEITKGEVAKNWIEREILTPMASYPYETNLGLISVKAFGGVSSTVGGISDADSIARAGWRGNYPKRVNKVSYLYNENAVSNAFESSILVQDDGLIARDGEFPLTIPAAGIRAALTDTADLLEDRSRAMIARFGLQLPAIAVRTLFQKLTLQVADDVAVTFAQLIDLSSGHIGLVDAPCEIIGVTIDFQNANVEFQLLAHPPIFIALIPDGDPTPNSEVMAFAYTSTPEY